MKEEIWKSEAQAYQKLRRSIKLEIKEYQRIGGSLYRWGSSKAERYQFGISVLTQILNNTKVK